MEEIKDKSSFKRYHEDLQGIGDESKSLDEIIELVVKIIKNIK